VGWQKVEGTYPDGVSDRLRLIALSESGAVVPLHDDGTLQPAHFLPSQRWLPEDGAVSWLALRWEGEDIVEWGLYTLDLEFTADGPVASGTPTLLDWTAELFWYYGEGQGPVYLNVENYDWSPDGSAIVYSAHEEDAGTQLYVADSMGGPVQLTSEVDAYPATPRWSPDGTRIVFQLNGQHQIDVIDLAGAERYTLITTSRTDYREMVFLPMWSPASTHLVYSYCLMGPRAIWKKVSLHRIAADGSDDAPLTGAYNHAHALGWRAEE
jgi:hypothetical protein